MKTYMLSVLLLAIYFVDVASGGSDSISSNGVNAIGLTQFDGVPLDGRNIIVGQVEDVRPGLPGKDDETNFNTQVIPNMVVKREGSSLADDELATDPHATQVASVLISTDTVDSNNNGITPVGIVPMAQLKASAYGNPAFISEYDAALLSTQWVATNGAKVINHSWSTELPSPVATESDGNSQLTLGMDWIANRYNILNVQAGDQEALTGGTGRPVPIDNFNGITVARSARDSSGVFRDVSNGNFQPLDAGIRTYTDILAPGVLVETAEVNDSPIPANNPTLGEQRLTGTSYAAPHVTGTAVMLQQYAAERFTAGADGWTSTTSVTGAVEQTAIRHEVLKAVIMNSADKLKDDESVMYPGTNDLIPEGRLLGMERTVRKKDNSTWFDSIAYDETAFAGIGTAYAVDEEMGAGHLNTKRALQQFIPGEHEEFGISGETVPLIGWDFGTTTGTAFTDYARYRFNEDLEEGHFISATLAWDRIVEFETDNGTVNEFDENDEFAPYTDDPEFRPADSQVNDLELYLMPAFAGNLGQAVALSSNDTGATVEHLFFEIPEDGAYELWVRQQDADVGNSQDFGLAWWYGLAPDLPDPGATSDFDGDGDIDGADLAQWQGDYGLNADSDVNNDGSSDGLDFLAWQREFTGPSSTASGSPVPEPSSLLLLGCIGMLGSLRFSRVA